MSKRDCEHCKHFIWDMDRKYRSCESWNCEFEKKEMGNEKTTDILQEMANRDN